MNLSASAVAAKPFNQILSALFNARQAIQQARESCLDCKRLAAAS